MKKSIYTSYDELPLLLNVKQLVDLMGVSDSSIYELIQEDDFPSLRIGKRIVVPKEELRKWIAAHTKGASGCRIIPILPNLYSKSPGELCANCPMVLIPMLRSLRSVAGPTYSRSPTGKG